MWKLSEFSGKEKLFLSRLLSMCLFSQSEKSFSQSSQQQLIKKECQLLKLSNSQSCLTTSLRKISIFHLHHQKLFITAWNSLKRQGQHDVWKVSQLRGNKNRCIVTLNFLTLSFSTWFFLTSLLIMYAMPIITNFIFTS